jgi:hypothetical protein
LQNQLLAEGGPETRGTVAATEKELARAMRVQRAQSAAALRRSARRSVQCAGRRHMAKHFQISITDDTFSSPKPLSIAAEAALDGSMRRSTRRRTIHAATVRAQTQRRRARLPLAEDRRSQLRPVFH